jgi:hypothetical protein
MMRDPNMEGGQGGDGGGESRDLESALDNEDSEIRFGQQPPFQRGSVKKHTDSEPAYSLNFGETDLQI